MKLVRDLSVNQSFFIWLTVALVHESAKYFVSPEVGAVFDIVGIFVMVWLVCCAIWGTKETLNGLFGVDRKWLKDFNKTKPNTPEREALLKELDERHDAKIMADPSFWLGQANYLLESCDEKYIPEILAAEKHARGLISSDKENYPSSMAVLITVGEPTEQRVKTRMAELPAQRERQAGRIREMLMK